MKRTLIPGLMLLAAFTLTNCSEQLAPPVQEDDIIVEETPSTEATEEEILGIPFEVYANASDEEVDTKTTNVDGGNNTAWEATDAIYVYHAPAGSTSGFTKNHKFSMRNLAENLFGGALYKEANLNATSSYDWYFIYPNKEEGLGSAGTQTSIKENVVIGANIDADGNYGYSHVQYGPNSKSHIGGYCYPMFGSATADGNKNPRVKMTHMSALVAIKVVNEGDGLPITIKDVEFSIPDMYDSKGKLIAGKEALPIVGDCEVTFLNKNSVSVDKSSATGAKYSHSTKVTLAEDVTLDEPGDAVTFYMAIRPLSFAANEREISIRVNGSERKIKNKEAIEFKSGSVTTIKVPVKSLTGSQITDALPTGEGESKVSPFTSVADRDDSKTYDILTVSGTKIEGGLIINGKQVDDVYQLGSVGGGIGKIKIEGYAKDMINALPISFNVSSMDNEPAAMTIESIDALIPQYRSSYGSIIFGVNEMNFKSDKVYRKRMNQHGILGSTLGAVAGAILSGLGVKLSDGLSRKELINFADPNVITFNNLPTNGYFSKGNVVVLDETNTNKNLSYDTIDYFLGEKFSYGGNTATYKGLYAILNAEYSKETGWKFEYPSYSEVADKGKVLTNLDDNPNNDMEEYALQTANGMYSKVKASLEARSLGDLFPIVVESSEHLMHLLRETKLEINISNYPYKKVYPEDEHLETGYKPIILWGLNATLPGER